MVVQEEDRAGSASPAPRKHRLRQRFDVKKKLGQGTYGKVQLAINKETGQEVAIKTIKKSKIESEQDLIRIRREIQIMSSIQHPHIIHIYEVFENKDKIVLVMQYASGGELYDYLSDKKVLDDKEARRIFRQIAAAVYYCHKNKICHRDLKLENVLIDDKGNAKLADFGLSNVFDDKHHLSTFCGSPLYASPEIVKGVPYYGPEVDCWSLGVLLFTLVYGSMPFDGTNFKRLVRQISEGEFYEPETKSGASPLIHLLLKGEPSERATIVDICSDPWINDGYDTSLLQLAEDLANLTPVRLDLLVALAPVSPSPSAKNLATEDEDTTTDTQASQSFTYVGDLENNPSVEDFLPAELALAELDAELAGLDPAAIKRQADGSLARISSMAHHTKKPKKSESAASSQSETAVQEDDNPTPPELSPEASRTKINDSKKVSSSSLREGIEEKKLELNTSDCNKVKSPVTSPTSMGRPPQKLILPKSFLSDSTTIPPVPKNSPEADKIEAPSFKSPADNAATQSTQQVQGLSSEETNKSRQSAKMVGEENLSSDNQNLSDEQKKLLAKGILKKNIAKAKLIERKLSQQSSVESDVSNISTPEPSSHPEPPLPSYIKAPKPYVKNERQESKVESRAEIVLSPTDTLKSSQGSLESNSEESPKHSKSYSRESLQSQGETLWEKRIDETLKKIAPEGVQISTKRKDELKKPNAPPPIARSYRKFTFTKDGACITETRKVYCNPNESGGWTKVEKKTTITHRSNPPPTELPDETMLKRSDSQSSSGSNDVFDDIFDTWTGDSTFCNIMKMKSMFNKFTRDTSDSFFRKPSREGSFAQRYDKKEEHKNRDASDGSDVEDEFSFHLNDSMPVIYGSQGLSKILRSINREMPRRLSSLLNERPSLIRTGSKESYTSKRSLGHESRVHSNYNHYGSNIRSISRERIKEPYFHVRLESPLSGKFGHRDSGVESWDESDYSTAAKGRYTLREEQVRRQGSKDDSLFENPRHRVEQWLHMSDVGDTKIPEETPSTMYGTIRPRNRYSHRCSSDKLSDRDTEKSYRTEVRLDRDGQVRKSSYSRTTSETSRSSDEVVLERRQSAGSFTTLGSPLTTDLPQRPGVPVVHMTVSFNRDAPPVVITSTSGRTPFVPRMTIHHETRE